MRAGPTNLFTQVPLEQFVYLASGSDIHATNGFYAYKGEVIIPKMLAGFQHVAEHHAKPDDVFLLGVNSDASFHAAMRAKNMSESDIASLESQESRAMKVGVPLALQNPEKLVVAMFYDEETPQQLYNALADARTSLATLHKWDYATQPNAAKIVGAENFKKTLGFPSADGSTPIGADLTPKEDQSGIVRVIDLTKEFGKHGAPYIDIAGKLLFPVRHDSLKGYTAEIS